MASTANQTVAAQRKSRWGKNGKGTGAAVETAADSSAETKQTSMPKPAATATAAAPPEVPTVPTPASASASASGKGKGNRLGAAGGSHGFRIACEPYESAARQAFLKKCQEDLKRLQQRPDFRPGVRWIDSHCHFESILQRTWRGGGKPQVTESEPLASLPDLVNSWPEGLDGGICNCVFNQPSKRGYPSEFEWLATNLHHFEEGSPIGHKIWFTVGIHPHDTRSWTPRTQALLRRFAKHPKCVGIGECGLDFFKHDQKEAEGQFKVFEDQVKLAVELRKALVVHGRLVTKENEDKCLALLKQHLPKDHPVHIHSYSDSLEHARDLMDHFPNSKIGFTGSITFKDRPQPKGKGKGKGKSVGAGGLVEKKGEEHNWELVCNIPLERMLIETDGPYMCPEPFRGQTAHPGHVHRVAEQIAEWQWVSVSEVFDATRKNTREVYGV